MLSTAIALLAAAIAFGQWYTARQKLILDLFDKRSERYRALRAATGPLLESARVEQGAHAAFNRAVFEMDYLFGRDVISHLEGTQDLLRRLTAEERKLAKHGLLETERQQLTVNLSNMDTTFQQRMKDVYPLILPYIQMQQRLPSPPWLWPRRLRAWVSNAYQNRPTGH